MQNKNKDLFKLSAPGIALLAAFFSGLDNKAQARDFFDPSFINSLNGSDPSNAPDLSVFEARNAQAPGNYRVDIVFNGQYLDTKTIKFVIDNSRASTASDEIKLAPCFSTQGLIAIWR